MCPRPPHFLSASYAPASRGINMRRNKYKLNSPIRLESIDTKRECVTMAAKIFHHKCVISDDCGHWLARHARLSDKIDSKTDHIPSTSVVAKTRYLHVHLASFDSITA